MTGKKTFEDRLADIARERGASLPFSDSADAAPEGQEPKPRRLGSFGLKFLLMIGLMLVFGAGAVAMFKDRLDMKNVMPDGVNLASLGVSGMLDFLPGKTPEAWTYLPLAPEGWIAVTPEDAGRDVQASIDLVAKRYPGGEDALRQHEAFQSIGKFLDVEGRPSGLLHKKTPTTEGRVMYVHPTAGIFLASLKFHRQDRVLGFEDTPSGWQDALAQMAEKGKPANARVQRLTFEGFPAVNLAQPLFAGMMPAAIDVDQDNFTNFDLRIAMNHRSVLTLTGSGQPRHAARLVTAIDGAALTAHLSHVTGSTPALTRAEEPAEKGMLSKMLSAPADL